MSSQSPLSRKPPEGFEAPKWPKLRKIPTPQALAHPFPGPALMNYGVPFSELRYWGCSFFPTLGVGLLDFKLNSSPRPELFSSPGLNLRVSLEYPRECPAQSLIGVPNPQSLPGVPTTRVSLECPESAWSAQPQCPRSAQPQSVPGVANPRISLPREGGDVRSKLYFIFYFFFWGGGH